MVVAGSRCSLLLFVPSRGDAGSRSSGLRSVSRSVSRRVGCPRAIPAKTRQDCIKTNDTIPLCHPVTLSPPPLPDVAHSQPQSGAPQSASVASQSNPTVFPTPGFLTLPPSLPSLPPFLAQIIAPTVDPDSALSHHPLGSVDSSVVKLSRMIAVADSQGRNLPHPASRCAAANSLVSPRPR
jgi:hypothetical protein